MRFYTKQHKYYCGIDLHTKKMYVCILNSDGDIVVAVECMFRVTRMYGAEFIPGFFGVQKSSVAKLAVLAARNLKYAKGVEFPALFYKADYSRQRWKYELLVKVGRNR